MYGFGVSTNKQNKQQSSSA